MSNDILVLAENPGGELADTTFELLGKAKELASSLGGQVIAALFGTPELAQNLGAADVVITMEHPSLAHYNPEAYEKALTKVVQERQPRLVLLATTTLGLDLAAALSVTWDAPLVSYVVGLDIEGSTIVATAQIYGGKLMAETAIEADKGICTVIAGSFSADLGKSTGSPNIEQMDPPSELDNEKISCVNLSRPEAGGIDITTADMLVSVGRGIQSEDNLEIVQELADAMGVPLSSSRPIIDQGWLPKPHQVGKSGLKVKPKVYLMFGISGAPEHLEGMRDAELIIACNTDESAPIFDVAHYGTTVDLFDLVPALVDKVQG